MHTNWDFFFLNQPPKQEQTSNQREAITTYAVPELARRQRHRGEVRGTSPWRESGSLQATTVRSRLPPFSESSLCWSSGCLPSGLLLAVLSCPVLACPPYSKHCTPVPQPAGGDKRNHTDCETVLCKFGRRTAFKLWPFGSDRTYVLYITRPDTRR